MRFPFFVVALIRLVRFASRPKAKPEVALVEQELTSEDFFAVKKSMMWRPGWEWMEA